MLSRKFFQLALALALATIPSPARADLTGVEAEAAKVRWEHLQSMISVVRQAATAPGAAGDSLREALRDRDNILFNQDKPPGSVYKARLMVASLFKDQSTRDLLVSAAIAEIRRASTEVKRTSTAGGSPLTVDELVLGMGPQGTAYAQEKTSADPGRVVLMVDRADKPGGTFADVGGAFRLNSTNRQDNGTRATPGQGDLNKITDIVGLPDFKGGRWVEAGSLGEVCALGVALSSALPMLETEVVQITRSRARNAPAYSVRLKDLESGKTFNVLTNRVVVASGLGKPKFGFTDAATIKLINREQRSSDRARRTPRIEGFGDFITRAGDPENRQPIRELIGKDVLVIGGGDSGRVVNELLTRLASEAAYKADVAQAGQVKRIFWFVGKNGFADCKEYIAKSRARYSQLAQALNSGQLVAVPGTVEAIRENEGGQFLIDTKIAQTDAIGRRIPRTRSGGKIAYLRPADIRVGRTEEELVTETVAFDKVIAATGFDSALPKVLAPLVGSDDPKAFQDVWQPVEQVAEAFGDKPVIVANELRDAPGIFTIGPANEILGGLPRKEELKGINENTVSLFANVERSKALARFLISSAGTAENPAPEAAIAEAIQPLLARLYPGPESGPQISLISGKMRPLLVSVTPETLEDMRQVPATELALRIGLDTALRGVQADTRRKSISLSLARGKSDNDYTVTIDGLRAKSPAAWSELFRGNPLLNSVLLRDYFNPATRISSIDVTLPINDSGTLDLARMEVTVRR